MNGATHNMALKYASFGRFAVIVTVQTSLLYLNIYCLMIQRSGN